MTTLGGQHVLAIMLAAGFRDDDAKAAAAVALAASGWQDHYQLTVPGSPSLDRYGLFALSPDQLDGIPRADWYHVDAQASRARELWESHGRTWEWNSAVAAQGGAFARAAGTDILAGNLFARPTVGTYRVREAHAWPRPGR